MPYRWALLSAFVAAAAVTIALAEPPKSAPPAGRKPPGVPGSDMELVERVLASRRDYQVSLEELRKHYLSVGDVEHARWAEDELIQYHRIAKQAYRLELEVPPPTLKPTYNIPEANK